MDLSRCFDCGQPVERPPGPRELPRCDECREDHRDRKRRLHGVELRCALVAVLAAMIGASIWAAIAYWTEHEIGYVAALLGGIVGLATRFAARDEVHARVAPIATAATILALIIGKLAAIAVLYMANGYPLGPTLYEAVISTLPDAMTPFDAVWVVLALVTAWRWSQPSFP